MLRCLSRSTLDVAELVAKRARHQLLDYSCSMVPEPQEAG